MDEPQLTRRRRAAKLLLAGLAGLLGAAAVMCGQVAVGTWNDAAALRAAAPFPGAAAARPGAVYRTVGAAGGGLLNPPDYPEVRDALLYRVFRERQGSGDTWTSVGTVAGQRLREATIGSAPVALSGTSRVLLPLTWNYREKSRTERLALEAVQPAGVDVVGFGTFDGRALADQGRLPLLLIGADREQELMETFEKSCRVKGLAGGALAGLLAALGVLIGTTAWRLPTTRVEPQN